MNYTLKAIQAAAISLPIILCSKTTAQAEELAYDDLDQNNDLNLEISDRTGQDLRPQKTKVIKNLLGENQSTSPVPKSLEQSPQNISSATQDLNPNSNYLQLPGQASEVKIKIDQQINLKQAVELAIKNNIDLQAIRLNLERSQKQLREEKAALFPSLSMGLNFTETESLDGNISLEAARQEAEGSLSTQQIEEFNNTDTSTTTFRGNLNLTYNLYTGGRRGSRIKQAEKLVNSSKLNLETAILETRFATIRDYYSLQSADSQAKIEQAAVDDARLTLQDAQLLRQAGMGTKFDVSRAEVELANAQQRLAIVRAEQSLARRQLAATLNVGQQVELKTTDEIRPAGIWQLSLEKSIVTAYKNRSELQELLTQREINQQEKQIALAAIRPQIDLVASYNLGDNLGDEVSLTDAYSVGAQLNWNLFDGGAASAKARQSETDVAINEAEFANQRNAIRLEVEQGYFSLAANQSNIATSQRALDLATENLDLARMRFQSGVGTQTDVIEAQTELTAARGDYLRAIIDFNQSLNQLKRAVAIAIN